MTTKFEINFLRICIKKKQVYEGFQENPWYSIRDFLEKTVLTH